jgi:hypothetical protein
MTHANFIHLRVHSSYSLSEGAIKPQHIAELCAKYGTNRGKVYELRKAGKLKAYRYDDDGRYLYEPLDDGMFHIKRKEA